MSKANQKAAEELEQPNEVSEVKPEAMSAEEIDALLTELSEQNADEVLPEPVALQVEEGGAATTEAPEATSEPAVIESAPEPEVLAEQAPEPAGESPTAFTMDDILRAASEATSLSENEIRNLESPTPEPQADIQDAAEDLTEAPEATQGETTPVREAPPAIPETPRVSNARVAEANVDAESEELAPGRTRRLTFGRWLMPGLAALVAVAIVAVGTMALAQWGARIERRLAARDAKFAESLGGMESVLEAQSKRLGRLEAAVDGKLGVGGHSPEPNAKVHGNPPATKEPAGHAKKGHAPEAKGHGKPATPKVDGHHPPTAHGHDAKKAPAASKKAPPKAAIGHPNPLVAKRPASVEGFHFKRGAIRIAGSSKPPHRLTLPKAKARGSYRPKVKKALARKVAPRQENRVRVYLDGKPVSPRR